MFQRCIESKYLTSECTVPICLNPIAEILTTQREDESMEQLCRCRAPPKTCGLNPINFSICSRASRTALVLFAKAATLHRGFTWSFSPDRPVVGAKSSPKFSDVPK